MANHLAHEASPYLLQHKDNPVDWFPWGQEALEKAKQEAKPIFLSIGYSACHWCHVMEHESFENAEIAAILNDAFVSIKVDREERPDLDSIYMTAVQMMTGRGGWPMSVFLSPDQKPFFGGTYWPPEASRGMPGFKQVLAGVADAWQNRRTEVIEQSGKLTDAIAQLTSPTSGGELTEDMLNGALATLERMFDASHGGFGGAPKFPHAMQVQLLLRLWRCDRKDAILDMATLTLDRMHAGGMYDHLAGGFARYSVDERWLVPHFEKMLYDNALLSLAYLEGYQATGDKRYTEIVRETLDFWLSDMTDSAGGFYSTLDADSEGVEGKFYVWTPGEIREVLGDDDRAETFCYVYDVTDVGNFEGKSILNLPKTIAQCAEIRGRDAADLAQELAASRARLLEARSRRVPPGCDDKVLVSWNGLLIDALARAGAVLGEPRYVDAATIAAEFIHQNLRRGDGRLLHTWRQGQAKLDAYLDDYTCLINGLISLYEATFDERWIDEAVRLADIVLEQFGDEREGGFFFTAADHESLIARQKDMHDSSTPSGNGMAAFALARLGRLTGEKRFSDAAEATLKAAAEVLAQQPMAAGQLLLALDDYLHPQPEVVLLGSGAEFDEVLADLRRRHLPGLVLAARPSADTGTNVSPALAPIFGGKQVDGDGPTAYICRDFTCQAPDSGKQAILAAWANA